MTKILIVEDEESILMPLEDNLRLEGYEVASAADGLAGLAMAVKDPCDLIILDIMLPKMDGFEVCRRLRQDRVTTPILMLTAKSQEIDKVLGLELGADDYMTKPFGQRELLARIHAVLRRSGGEPPAAETVAFDDVRIDFKRKTAVKGGRELALTAKEFGLLQLLAARADEVVSRETILSEVWGYDKFPTTRTVDTFVHNLRKKIEKNPSEPVHLLTIPWMGYKFRK